jgi:CXXC-20-CXXC protein
MPTCKSCHQKWTWKYTFGKLLSMKREMPCSHCGKVQYISKKSRKKMSFMSLIPIIPLFFSTSYNLSAAIYFLISVSLFLIVLALTPLFLELTDEEKVLY